MKALTSTIFITIAAFFCIIVNISFTDSKNTNAQATVGSVKALRALGVKSEALEVQGYYSNGDCPPFTVKYYNESDAARLQQNIKDDGVMWFSFANDATGRSGWWKRTDTEKIDIRQTGAIGDLRRVETPYSKVVATGDGQLKQFSFALQKRVKPGSFSIAYTDVNNNRIEIKSVDYGDETGLLVNPSNALAPVGLVYYITGRVEGAELGDWGLWMQEITNKAAKGDSEAIKLKSNLLNNYKNAGVKANDLLSAALSLKQHNITKGLPISGTRYYTSKPVLTGLSPYKDQMYNGAPITLPTAPKAGTPVIVKCNIVTISGTYNLPDGRTNTQAVQSALDGIKCLEIPSAAELKKSIGHGGDGFLIRNCFVPGNRIIEGPGKETAALLQFYYDPKDAYLTKWLTATETVNGILRFVQPDMISPKNKLSSKENTTSDEDYDNKEDLIISRGKRERPIVYAYIFSNKFTGNDGGNIVFRGLNLVGAVETLGPQYYDCYWDMDRRYQGIKTWNKKPIKEIKEPTRYVQHNINMVEVPNITIDNCETSWALEDGAYFGNATSWLDPSTSPDYRTINVNKGISAKITITNNKITHNGRNGSFITSGKSIIVSNNIYEYNQIGCQFDRSGQPQNFPSGALAFEEHNKDQYLQDLQVVNNKVFNSFFEGGHFLGNGAGIVNLMHQRNIYSWDYADWYSPISLIRTSIIFGSRIKNLDNSNNRIINSPGVSILVRLDANKSTLTNNNSFTNDSIYNSGKHAIEVKHSPQLTIKAMEIVNSGWQKSLGQNVEAMVYLMGATSGVVEEINVKDEANKKAKTAPIKLIKLDQKTPQINSSMINTSKNSSTKKLKSNGRAKRN